MAIKTAEALDNFIGPVDSDPVFNAVLLADQAVLASLIHLLAPPRIIVAHDLCLGPHLDDVFIAKSWLMIGPPALCHRFEDGFSLVHNVP